MREDMVFVFWIWFTLPIIVIQLYTTSGKANDIISLRVCMHMCVYVYVCV